MSNKEIIFATNNLNKLNEIRVSVKKNIFIKSLSDINFFEDIPETSDTLIGNARQKARYIFDKFGFNCFSDDTGLMVNKLNMEPGVHSARYAGLDCSVNDNIEKVLFRMKEIKSRGASFKTVICLIYNKKEYLFQGEVKGKILYKRKGVGGFGYDSIFQPIGYNKTFAEMSLLEKNSISHRGIAVKYLVDFLNQI
tara:strand:+ start:204 stop:788 length:585 start_codon:yes stop_codon:yes gene_type:complete